MLEAPSASTTTHSMSLCHVFRRSDCYMRPAIRCVQFCKRSCCPSLAPCIFVTLFAVSAVLLYTYTAAEGGNSNQVTNRCYLLQLKQKQRECVAAAPFCTRMYTYMYHNRYANALPYKHTHMYTHTRTHIHTHTQNGLIYI
jgi:hypothetical protein